MIKNKPFVQLGRNLGEFPKVSNRRVFLVMNGVKQQQLTPFECAVWGQVSSFKTLEQWESMILDKIAHVKNFNWQRVLKKLIDEQLIICWEFSSVEDPNLVHIYATRQGYAHGLVNGKWLMSDTQVKQGIVLTKDQFDVWNAAAGKAMLLEVIDTLMKQRGIALEEAFALLVNNGFRLTQIGLWNLEYIDLEKQG
ncbi:hypothetical protein [Cytobacillus praedii]|uniref:hypothetical protein n=1 Tax=Cytobacillus praedii TaxID=1742358 RepID=UPI002E2439F7|nr:hypothetical protein [Cytobacillus praedii]